MDRPTLKEAAKARAELQRYCAMNPGPLADAIKVLLRQSAPFYRDEVDAELLTQDVASQHGAMSDALMNFLQKHFGG